MIRVNGGEVYISRGDDASFDIVFGDMKPDDAYPVIRYPSYDIPENGTVFIFTVKVDVNRYKAVIKKMVRVYNGFATIQLPASDTAHLPFGEYVWDIRFLYPNINGLDLNTPFNPQPFFVCETVGNPALMGLVARDNPPSHAPIKMHGGE